MLPDAAVDWVASLLMAAWQRQEAEGRYRGADEFRALTIDPRDAVASWRAAVAPPAPWPTELAAWFDDWSCAWTAAEALGLDRAERLVAALAGSAEREPRLRPLLAALGDDPARQLPGVGLACEVAGALGVSPGRVRAACAPDGALRIFGLLSVVEVAGRPSALDALLVPSGWLVDGAPAQVRWVEGAQDETSDDVVVRGAADAGTPWVLEGADHVRHAEALAGLGRAALVEQPGERSEGGLGAAARAATVAGAVLVLACDVQPDEGLAAGCRRLADLGARVAVSLAPGVRWVAPADWRPRRVPPLDPRGRALRWSAALDAHRIAARPADLERVAGELVLGAGAIDEAARRAAAARHGDAPERVDLDGLRRAARRTVWRDLASVARPGPTGVGWDDLVVAPAVRRQLEEAAGAIGARAQVMEDWGFGDRPGARGYHLLFAGPSGTGKTLSAAVVAREVGLELWVVDLARVVDKYLGETEKQLDRVLRAGEAAGALLLFDEADALFGRRGEVREARDRWANVEVAYLLQRIEDHDGVTVLTTNLSQNMDEAFARRVSQRVEFAVPDAPLRRELWRRSVPAAAPADAAALATVADRFELAGGAIRTAALNAAYEAAAGREAIGLGHLVRATVRELTKAGHAPTRAELADLEELVGR